LENKRIFVEKKTEYNAESRLLEKDIKGYLGIDNLESVRVVNVYEILHCVQNGIGSVQNDIGREDLISILADEGLDNIYYEDIPIDKEDRYFQVELLPGQYNQREDSANKAIKIVFETEDIKVKHSKLLIFSGIEAKDLDLIKKYYINPVEMRLYNGQWTIDNGQLVGGLASREENLKVENIKGFTRMTESEINKIKDINPLLECFNIEEKHIGIGDEFISPKIISTGLPDIILPLKEKSTLDNLNINLEKLSILSKKLDVIGVHAFYLPEKDSNKVYTRNFAPLVGINEEAATGTSNGSLIYFLEKEGYIINGEIISLQGESLNRPSNIYCKIEKLKDDYIVKVGGQAKIVLEGVICI